MKGLVGGPLLVGGLGPGPPLTSGPVGHSLRGDAIYAAWSGMMPGVMYGAHAGAVPDMTQLPVYQHHQQQFGLLLQLIRGHSII